MENQKKRVQKRNTRKQCQRMEDFLHFSGGMLFLTSICMLMMMLVFSVNQEWVEIGAILEGADTIRETEHSQGTDVAEGEDKLSTEQNLEKEGNSNSEQEESQIEADTSISEITIMAVGDNLMHKSVTYNGLQEDGTWDFSGLFANIQPELEHADISILCQEVIMGGVEIGISGYPSFNTVQELGHSIVKAGFDVVAFANNHTLDKALKGVTNTIAFWEEHYPDFCYVGIHESEEARNEISVIEQNGIKVAILNYTYGLNGRSLPSGKEYMVDLLTDEKQMIIDIQKAKVLADFVIVIPHWGTENSFEIDKQQQKLTQIWAELGVDLVIGSHPHVVQPVQWVEREEDENPMLVYYSLGNFVSIQDKKETMLGAMAKITIQKKNGETYIADHSMDILVTHYESHAGEEYYTNVTTYPIKDYTPELASQHAITANYDHSFSYESITELAQWLLERAQ